MLSFLTSKSGLVLVGVVLIALALAVVSRNWSCRTSRLDTRIERREERSHKTIVCPVKAVTSGAGLTVAWGIRSRSDREVILEGISIPSSVAADSKANLEKLVGSSVTILYISHGLFSEEIWKEVPCELCGGTGEEDVPELWRKHHPEAPEKQPCMCGGSGKWLQRDDSAMEKRDAATPLVGLVYGEGNRLAQVEQLAAGLAVIDKVFAEKQDIPEEFVAAQASAKKSKLGCWKK